MEPCEKTSKLFRESVRCFIYIKKFKKLYLFITYRDRNLASAELRWYRSLIKSDSKKTDEAEEQNNFVDEESIIENAD